MTLILLPTRLRFALCLMLGAYPLITFLLFLFNAVIDDWPLPARTALVVPFMVLGMVFFVIPAVNRYAGHWIKAGQAG
jgi:antibiotic biosynthesis monooxygenase (ABM) superfamily enzyme